MLVDFREHNEKHNRGFPYQIYDVWGNSCGNLEQRIQIADTGTGECTALLFDKDGHPILTDDRNDIRRITLNYQPPLRLVDRNGNEVTSW